MFRLFRLKNDKFEFFCQGLRDGFAVLYDFNAEQSPVFWVRVLMSEKNEEGQFDFHFL